MFEDDYESHLSRKSAINNIITETGNSNNRARFEWRIRLNLNKLKLELQIQYMYMLLTFKIRREKTIMRASCVHIKYIIK